MPDEDDGDLLDRFAHGDQAAFEPCSTVWNPDGALCVSPYGGRHAWSLPAEGQCPAVFIRGDSPCTHCRRTSADRDRPRRGTSALGHRVAPPLGLGLWRWWVRARGARPDVTLADRVDAAGVLSAGAAGARRGADHGAAPRLTEDGAREGLRRPKAERPRPVTNTRRPPRRRLRREMGRAPACRARLAPCSAVEPDVRLGRGAAV
jgi:hypothetical protein